MLSFVSVNLFAIFLLWLLLNKMAQTKHITCRVSSVGCCFLSLPLTGEVILKYSRIVNNTVTLLYLEREFHSENLRNTGFIRDKDFSYPFSRPNFPFGQKNQNWFLSYLLIFIFLLQNRNKFFMTYFHVNQCLRR